MKHSPNTTKIKENNHLEISGCDAVELAKEFGTPLYVMDEATIRDRCQQYIQSFKKYHKNTQVIYACKALCVAGILKVIAAEGLGLDVASSGEIATALKAGANPKTFYFQSNNKPIAELKIALEAGLGVVVVDNPQELENLDNVADQLGKKVDILFRINPGIEAHTHEYIKTGVVDSKFGVPGDEIDKAVKSARAKKNIKLLGFHAHIGSQIFELKPFVAETKLLLELSKKHKTNTISIGGGLGAAYFETDKSPAIADLAKAIADALKDNRDLNLIVEPGRSIVCNAGITLYTVGALKDIPKIRKYVFVDGGMGDNLRPILYQAKYDALIANKAQEQAQEKVTVAGRFCESGDVLIKEINLPKVEVGDILAVLCTGAYGYSMASNYNRVARPAMVLVNNGKATLIVKRESCEDLVANDLIL